MQQAATFAIAFAVIGIISLSRIPVDPRTTGLHIVVERLFGTARAAEGRAGPPVKDQARLPVH